MFAVTRRFVSLDNVADLVIAKATQSTLFATNLVELSIHKLIQSGATFYVAEI